MAQTEEKEEKMESKCIEFYFDGKKLSKQDHILLFEFMGDTSQHASDKLKEFICKASNEKQKLMNQPFNKWLIDDKLHSKEPDLNSHNNYDFGARARIPIIFGDSKYVKKRFPFESNDKELQLYHLLKYETIIYLLFDNKPSKTELNDKTLIIHGNKDIDLIKTVENWIQKMKYSIENENVNKIHIENFV